LYIAGRFSVQTVLPFSQRREEPSLAAFFVSSGVMGSRLARSRRGGFVTFRNGQNGEGFGRTDGGAPRHRPLEVTVGDRGVEGALRLFKRLVLRDGILREVKRHAHYEKPGDRRRRKVREAARRLRKRLAKARERGEQID
jgi:small subunit ribosomal protein S21